MLAALPKQTECYFGFLSLTFNQLTTLNSRTFYFRATYWFFRLTVPHKQNLIYRTRQRTWAKVKSSDLRPAQQHHCRHVNRVTDRLHCIKSSHVPYVVLCALFFSTPAFSSLYPNCVSPPLPGPRIWPCEKWGYATAWPLERSSI